MKVQVDSAEALKAIRDACSVIGPRPVSQTLSSIQITSMNEGHDELILRATNGSVDIVRLIPCETEETGTVLLDGKKMAAIFSTLPSGKTTILASEGKPSATVRASNMAKFTLAITNGELPARPVIGDDGFTATMSADDLEAALSTVKYAIATDQTRIILTGVLLEVYADKVNAVALDGYRLALSQKPCVSDVMAEHESCVVPGEALPVIMAALDGAKEATVESDGKQLRVQTEYGQATTGLLVGDYLDYRKTIPRDYKASIRFFGRDMMESLKRSIAIGKVSLVKMSLTDAMTIVESNMEGDSFYEEVPCQHSGESMSTAFNVKYFMEALNATGANELQLDLISPTTAGVIRRTDGEKELHLILPVRVKNSDD